jgi:lysophospholipase L1-like esterase
LAFGNVPGGLGRNSDPVRALLLLVLLVCLAGCSLGMGGGSTGGSGEPRPGAVRPETTAQERTATEDRATSVPARLDYVALGDSLAAGVGAERGYVERYAGHLRDDTGAEVRVANFGVSGQTAPQLLNLLRNDPGVRGALREAEVVTFNIGINDLGEAGMAYEDGSCGGPDNEECLRAVVEALEKNWDAVVQETLRLRSTDDAIIRTAGLGYTPDVGGVFEPYLGEVNRHIAASAEANGVPHVEVRLGAGGMSADGVHPNGAGYQGISDRLRTLGYEPLSSR